MRAAIAARATVVVTCDCGTSALAPIQALCAEAIDVIVSDHHLPGRGYALPTCLAALIAALVAPSARRLRAIGWTLLATTLLGAALLVAAFG